MCVCLLRMELLRFLDLNLRLLLRFLHALLELALVHFDLLLHELLRVLRLRLRLEHCACRRNSGDRGWVPLRFFVEMDRKRSLA
jgi:hypothetical protein